MQQGWRCIAYILIFNTLAGLLNARTADPVVQIKNFSKKEYNAEYQNWKADLGPDHFLYVANNAGLLVYDGTTWQFFHTPEINNLRTVKSDHQSGRIYTAGYREIGYWKWDEFGDLKYTSLTPMAAMHFTSNEEFWNIVILDGYIYFQSFQSLFRYNGKEFKVIKPEGFMNTISLSGDKLLLHIRDRGIFTIENDTVIPYATGEFYENKLVRFFTAIDENSFLIGTAEQGLFHYDGRSYAPAIPEIQDYLINSSINRGALLNKDTLIIGTILDGIVGISLKDNKVFHINEENGLQNNTVLDIIQADENVWVMLDRGISYIDLHPDPSVEIHEVNEIGAVYSAAILDERLYLGTNQGLYYRELNDEDASFRLVPGTQSQVWDLKIVDDLLFVGHNSGTFIVRNGKLEQVSRVPGGFDLIKNSFSPNTMIQSTYSDLLFYRKAGSDWILDHRIRNFSDLIRYIELDHLNHLWAGHMRRGVYKLKLNDAQDSVVSLRYYGKNSIFNREYGIDVFKVENRIVFTTGEAIYTYDDIHDSIIYFTALNQALGDFAGAHRIVKGMNHHYWFLTADAAGLFFFGHDSIMLIKEFPAGLFDKHIIEGYENVIPLDEKIGIYCLENGYAILNGGLVPDATNFGKNNLILRKIALVNNDGKEELLNISKEKYNIPFSKNSVNLQFGIPVYHTGSITFKYMMEGLQSDWSDSRNEGTFSLNRLPPGEYMFTVKAIDDWNNESVTYSIAFRVLLPWYRSVGAWIIYALVLAGVISYVRYTSVRKVKIRERKKQEAKEQELVKLRNQNLRTELSFKSRELANSTMSIIKKNEFLLQLKEILRDHKYQLGTRYPDKYYQSVIRKIDRNISSGDDWRIFETNVEKAHEFFLQKLINEYPELTHSDLRLCTYLRMNLTSKEIAPLMRISVRGVENHRYRLRKKLGLDPSTNLTDFILAFEV